MSKDNKKASLSEDELLAIAASSPETHSNKDEQETNSVHKFINEYKITPSTDKVWNGIIYLKYVESGGKLSNIVFFREFKKSFNSSSDGQYRYYHVDKQPFDMSEEYFWKVIKYQNNKKLKKIKNKKIQKLIEEDKWDEFFEKIVPVHLKFKKRGKK